MTPARLRFWTDGRVLSITPSISVGSHGSPALYSIGDFYLLELALSLAIQNQLSFTTIGRTVDAIGKHPDWPGWTENRGVVLCKLSANSVELFYDARTQAGELRSKALTDALRKHSKTADNAPTDRKGEAIECVSTATVLYLSFDLKVLLDDADQRLAKILG